MGPPKNNANIRESEVKVKMDPGKPKTQHRQKNPEFVPWPKFTGACGALMGQTFSWNWTEDFKATLDNIVIYVGDTYIHDMRMKLKSQKEAIILQTYGLKDNATKSTKYIWKLELKN